MQVRKIVGVAGLALAVMTAGTSSVEAQIPVTDVASLAEQVQMVLYWVQQISDMESQIQNQVNQYNQMVDQFNSFNGIRNMGSILNSTADQQALQYLPPDWQTVASMATQGAGGQYAQLSSSIQQYLKANQTYTPQQMGLPNNSPIVMTLNSSANQIATSQALGQANYEAMGQQIANLQTLVNEVNQTTDPKESTDLNARIAAANAQLLGELGRVFSTLQQQTAQAQTQQLQSQQALLKMSTYQPSGSGN